MGPRGKMAKKTDDLTEWEGQDLIVTDHDSRSYEGGPSQSVDDNGARDIIGGRVIQVYGPLVGLEVPMGLVTGTLYIEDIGD